MLARWFCLRCCDSCAAHRGQLAFVVGAPLAARVAVSYPAFFGAGEVEPDGIIALANWSAISVAVSGNRLAFGEDGDEVIGLL